MPIEKRWVIKPQGDPQKVDELATATGIPRVLANLLVQRGIDTYDEVSRFFSPKLSDLHDPFLMKDMEKAVRRVDEAVTRGQKIMVYGDYDVDGTTAVALVYIFLRQMGMEELLFYIPDRYTEGYGISKLGVDYAKKNGVDLIIALDCGIKAVEKVAYANQLESTSSSATTICRERRYRPPWRYSTPNSPETTILSTNSPAAELDSNSCRDTASTRAFRSKVSWVCSTWSW